MKVVINKCFGGFSLSPLAVKTIAEWQGRSCYFFTSDYKNLDRYVPCADPGETMFLHAFDIPNPNEVFAKTKNWNEMSSEEKDAHNSLYERHNLTSRPESRTDPLLIRVVEELGEKANGSCAELAIVEIPDDVEYVIDEYDGRESIHEAHRSWS